MAKKTKTKRLIRTGPTEVYYDFPSYYVRICPLETKRFPHGLALTSFFATNKEAHAFADLVDEYLEDAFSNTRC